MTTTAEKSGQFTLGDRSVHRIGYGAMQLSGPHILGRPADRDAAIAVLRRAVELGIDHIDTSDYYGPHVTNEIIREALHPYPDDLTIVTKVGARRTPDGELAAGAGRRRAAPGRARQPRPPRRRRHRRGQPADARLRRARAGSLAEPMEALAALQQEGLVKHIGVSNVTAADRRGPGHRPGGLRAEPLQPRAPGRRRAGRRHRARGHRLRALLPARRVQPAAVRGAGVGGPDARRPRRWQVALAWLLARSPNILLIPGTRRWRTCEENLESAARVLGPVELAELDRIGGDGTLDPDL